MSTILAFLLVVWKNISIFAHTKDLMAMANDGFFYRAFRLYYDGFRSMTLGKTLWLVIAIKVFIIFVVLKIFFFPNFLSSHAEKGGEADFVATELLQRQPESPVSEGCGVEQETNYKNTHIINQRGDERRSDPLPPRSALPLGWSKNLGG